MLEMKDEEIEIFYRLVERLTGTSQSGNSRKDILCTNVLARMRQLNIGSLKAYLEKVQREPSEFSNFLSLITIHTTSWFREEGHFEFLQNEVEAAYLKKGKKKFTVWSGACSSGQELYSAGLILESLRKKYPDLEYQLYGSDIDELVLHQAQKGLFQKDELRSIPNRFLEFVRLGQGQYEGFFTLDKKIRDRAIFRSISLAELTTISDMQNMDFVFCRNVLIYFSPEKIDQILASLSSHLCEGGYLILGHSESLFDVPSYLVSKGRSCYMRKGQITRAQPVPTTEKKQKKVLVVDDIAVVRTVLKKIFVKGNFEVIEAESAAVADAQMAKHFFDLVTLDLNMPGESGMQWLVRHRKTGMKTPVIVVTSADGKEAGQVFEALSQGAQDYFTKENLNVEFDKFVYTIENLTRQRGAQATSQRRLESRGSLKNLVPEVIAIGASTGGPNVIWEILRNFPKPVPPILIVQHTSSSFAPHFASTVERASGLQVSGAIDGECLAANKIYISHGDYHIKIVRNNAGSLELKHDVGPAVNGHRASVDVLFHSLAEGKISTYAVLLTGMGSDGAKGMTALFDGRKSLNFAQSEETCAVYGMPKIAIQNGGVHFVGSPAEIRTEILELLSRKLQKAV